MVQSKNTVAERPEDENNGGNNKFRVRESLLTSQHMAKMSPCIQSNYLHAVGKNHIVPAINHPNDISFQSYNG